jgi:ribosomal protein S12 methylthiotransferase accessory factor
MTGPVLAQRGVTARVPVEERKVCVEGTHRTRTPEETWRWVTPVFDKVGITRVADVTWLDDIGIPVFQAIRPDSWSLCLSQGKGLTADLAKVSAVMESIELWHGEHMVPAERVGSPRELAGELGYRVEELALTPRSAVNLDCSLEWSPARVLGTEALTWLPTELLNMDRRTGDRWKAMRFQTSTNGLASGNTLTEAVLHGLYEVIERDAVSSSAGRTSTPVVDLESVTGPGAAVIEQMRLVGVEVLVTVHHSPTGLPCFEAMICSDSLPVVFHGHGCHLDRDVAICRALTEAAQSRATVIAAARDDLPTRVYSQADGVIAGRRRQPDLADLADGAPMLSYEAVDTVRHPDLAADLCETVARVTAATGREPVYVDHTRADLGIPVVHVVCPTMRFDPQRV